MKKNEFFKKIRDLKLSALEEMIEQEEGIRTVKLIKELTLKTLELREVLVKFDDGEKRFKAFNLIIYALLYPISDKGKVAVLNSAIEVIKKREGGE